MKGVERFAIQLFNISIDCIVVVVVVENKTKCGLDRQLSR